MHEYTRMGVWVDGMGLQVGIGNHETHEKHEKWYTNEGDEGIFFKDTNMHEYTRMQDRNMGYCGYEDQEYFRVSRKEILKTQTYT